MTDDTSGTDDAGDTSDTSDTDKIPVPQRTEVERKPRIAHTIRILALPIVIIISTIRASPIIPRPC